MIETLFSLDALHTPVAFLLATVIGLGFGVSLEQAGFGSSRRLAAIFYFRDMTVLKVMFTAVITAMLGLSYCLALGILRLDQVNLLETIYGAQIVGGLIFGVGFVAGGWCPGTAAVGLASGRIDALIFLVGAMVGTLLFNEAYPQLEPLVNLGNQGISMVYDLYGVSRPVFAFAFAGVAVVSFWVAEAIEEYFEPGRLMGRLRSLLVVTFGFLFAAWGLFLPLPNLAEAGVRTGLAGPRTGPVLPPRPATVPGILATVETGADHLEPEDLADRLMSGQSGVLAVDVRSEIEFRRFHLRGAINVPLRALPEVLQPYKNQGLIVLYSTGMTHAAQARDLLALQGFANVFLLTDGINGFISRCLKPASLRGEPVDAATARRIAAWRAYFQPGHGPGEP